MDINKQVEIMEGQLSNFKTLMEKMQYMKAFFDPDPEFTVQARDIVRSNICKAMKEKV